MRRAPRALLSALTLVVVVTSSSVARAQSPSADEAAAEALFNEGRALVEKGRVEEGCNKLQASQALDPGTGTLLHLADCYEKLGRTATAWATFREAASRAARDGRTDWETIAKTRSSELEPKLASLRIDAAPGVSVKRDGIAIPDAALGSTLPIDPGEHALTASGPGKKARTLRVVAVSGAVVTVVIPPLEDDAAAPPFGASAAPREASTESTSSLRTLGFVAGAVGIVGLVVGTVTGLSAISLNHRSKQVCPTSGVCADDGARSDNDSARTAATLSTIGFVAGGALVLGGVALVVFAPSSTRASSTSALAPSAKVRVSAQALWLEGTW